MADEPTKIDPVAPASVANTDGIKPSAASVSMDSTVENPGKERPDWLAELDPEGKYADFDAFKADYDKNRPAMGELPKEEVTEEEKPAEGDTKEAATEEGKFKTVEEAPAEKVAAVKAQLKEAGGLYADPRYERAALEVELTGALSPETMKTTAEAFGVPEAAVQQFLDGQMAQRELAASKANAVDPATLAVAQEIVKIIPGDADYAKFVEWGKANLSATEQAAYDKALAANDKDTVSALLGAYHAKYQAAGNGPGPRDVTTEAGNASDSSVGGIQPYATQADMQADIGKPEYEKSESFRKQVFARAAVSKW